MKIATEIGWGHKAGGGRRVAINTLLAMAQQRPEHEYVVYSNCSHLEFNQTLISQVLLKAPSLVPEVVWDQVLFTHLAVPFATRTFKPDVIHYTTNIIAYWSSTPAVVTIHDMTPFVLAESYGRCHGAYQRSYFRFAARKARKIITVSENSKEDICRILKVNEKKVVAVPLAANIKRQVGLTASLTTVLRTKFGIIDPFVLYVGAIHPRKNVSRIIEAYSMLRDSKNISHQLVIAGSFRWLAKQSIQASAFTEAEKHIVFTGPVTDNELVALYANCDAFVYPSLYEGFGLPVLEAMSLGAPVITSKTSSLPEVAGNAALLVNPLDVEEISQGIWKVIDDPSFADVLRKRGLERAAKFSWQKTARMVLEVLESVL